MKKCPKCGALMKADVNFCTNCGTDIRKVPVEKINTSNAKNNDNTGKTSSKAGQERTQAKGSLPSVNYWQWLVQSWKHPFGQQNGESWYGWVTFRERK